jgi:hypothetical protein
MRRENLTMEDALQNLPAVEAEDEQAPIKPGTGEPLEVPASETKSLA